MNLVVIKKPQNLTLIIAVVLLFITFGSFATDMCPRGSSSDCVLYTYTIPNAIFFISLFYIIIYVPYLVISSLLKRIKK